jgi:Fic family protein
VSTPVLYHLDGFPPTNIDWAELVPLIGRANAALARYDGLVQAMPNASVLLSPLTVQEAVLSSRIEGTNVTLSEVLEIEAGVDGTASQPKRDDAEEIGNYRRALTFAAQEVTAKRLTPHLLRSAHALLMNGVRGRDKDPGAFRTQQNWIGASGAPIERASFVPIPQEQLQPGLERWAAYAGSTAERDPLVQLAVLQFEALHPFKDGNGRLGRMIIPLFLFERRVLSGPNFYMSGYLEARREQYIELMRAISSDGAWTPWCAFFLEGLIEQASENQRKAEAILALYQRMQRQVADLTRSPYASRAVQSLFVRPVFSTAQFVENSGIPKKSVTRFLRLLEEAGLLRLVLEAAGSRPAIYVFRELLNLAEGKALF